jgi:hypothetical protein
MRYSAPCSIAKYLEEVRMLRMLVEIPGRVQPAAGARAVPFPWSPAGTVLAALADARSALSLTLDTRAWNAFLVTCWEGAFRDEFDEAYARVCAATGDLVERARSRAEAVVDAADDANRAQRLENDRAANLLAGLAGVGAGAGPG